MSPAFTHSERASHGQRVFRYLDFSFSSGFAREKKETETKSGMTNSPRLPLCSDNSLLSYSKGRLSPAFHPISATSAEVHRLLWFESCRRDCMEFVDIDPQRPLAKNICEDCCLRRTSSSANVSKRLSHGDKKHR